uniref:Uncharacterized protein n=1 Tax=Tetranychus urticae TaxID=32264 RepID=T1KKG5_TETUR
MKNIDYILMVNRLEMAIQYKKSYFFLVSSQKQTIVDKVDKRKIGFIRYH